MLKALEGRSEGQISLEFLIVYSFVLVIFILLFSIVTNQRAAVLGQQQYYVLQTQTQNIASYIDQAVIGGSGYSATIPLTAGLGTGLYNISISTTGVIIAGSKVGSQPVYAYGFSNARNFVINGTLTESSGGISVYQLQTQKGSISIANSKGIIYINQQPPAIAALAQSAIVTQQANVKAAQFNGANSLVNIGTAPSLQPNTLTISVWFKWDGKRYPASIYEDGATLVGKGFYSNGEYTLFMSRSTAFPAIYFYFTVNGGFAATGTWNAPDTNWHNLVATYNGTTARLYLDGSLLSSGSYSTTIQPTAYPLCIGSEPGTYGSNDIYDWGGDMADVQIYNAALSANQMASLYAEGIGGAPVIPANEVGWWPLNGNANDYSGNGNHGAPTAVQYQDVVQLASKVSSGSNINNGILVGFATSIGSIGAGNQIQAGASYTNSNGIATAFLTSNAFGSGNVTFDVFNENLSTEGNLVGWWPLDTGFGNSAFDLSGEGNNGIFNSFAWTTMNQTSFAAAKFPGNPGGVVNSNTQDGFITINNSQSLLNTARNKSFTAVAWIYYTGQTPFLSPTRWQGIFGSIQNTCGGCQPCGAGFQLEGGDGQCLPNPPVVLWINNSFVEFPSGGNAFVDTFPRDRWEMVVAEYNGTTGMANVYLNNTIFASNMVGVNLGLAQTGPYYIGDDAFEPGGLDTFNGSISNLQLYSTYLSPSQINSLYQQGITSTPLSDAGLISWWPLAGNAKDYSFNNNTGVVNYNVTFANNRYSINLNSSPQASAAFFNGANSLVNIGTAPSLQPNTLTISVWFKWDGKRYPASIYEDGATLVGKGFYSNGEYTLFMSRSTAFPTIYFYFTVNGGFAAVATWNAPDTNWHNLVATYNGTNARLYLDGSLLSSGSYSATIQPTAYPLCIGSEPGTYGSNDIYDWGGNIADVQIYNAALTQQQVMQLYAQGFPIQNKINVSIG